MGFYAALYESGLGEPKLANRPIELNKLGRNALLHHLGF